jgi:hypothetical protein
MRLFHFSDKPDIKVFEPRPVLVPSRRPPGREWLNGPLVWAIDEPHQPMYLFPRDCPRILLWLKAETSEEDRARWFGNRSCRMLAYIEAAWSERVTSGFIYRYELGDAGFENLCDAGMWVSRSAVAPIGLTKLDDLPAQLQALDVELIAVENLLPLKNVWNTTLHASGLRLRGAKGWDQNWP